MKSKLIFVLAVLLIVSCVNENDESVFELESTIDVTDLEMQACDCAPPGLGEGTGGGSTGHVYDNYQYYGDVTISGTYYAAEIINKPLVSLSYGINLNGQGQIQDSVIGNIDYKNEVSLIGYVNDGVNLTFLLSVKGTKPGNRGQRIPTYVEMNIIVPIANLPQYSGGGTGGSGVFPYNE